MEIGSGQKLFRLIWLDGSDADFAVLDLSNILSLWRILSLSVSCVPMSASLD